MIETLEKLPPHSIEAEQSLLGSLLLDRDAIIKVAPFLRVDDFYREAHARIYEAVLDLYNRREPPDLITIHEELSRNGRAEYVGGASYLTWLMNSVPTSVHIEYYGRIVERTATMRRLIGAGSEIAGIGYEDDADVGEALDRAEQTLYKVAQRRSGRDFVTLRDALAQFFDRLDYLHQHRGEIVGVPTGFHDLDQLTGGLQRSDLVIIAARPSVGKTAFALSIAAGAAIKHNQPVGVFSLEMSAEQLVLRLLAMETGIDSHRLRMGYLDEDEWGLLTQAFGKLAEAPVYIDDTAGASSQELRSKARRLHAQAGADLIVIDYLQLMQGGRTDNRVQEISEISRGLKGLARELNVPVVALSQLSRAVEQRADHKPMLSDLRESGCLTGESLVYLPDTGGYARIDSLVGNSGFNVLALNTETWKLERRQVTKAFATGRKQVYKLTTRVGRTIRATANHKFLAFDGWQRLDSLTAGQRIALPASDETTMSHTGLYKANLGRERAARVAEAVGSRELALLAASDVYWDEVVSVEPDGEEEVFDLTVEGLHNFVADEVIVHNSIEQDADVVMFIYREELYNPQTDKKNIAEIHVSKHRNGPVGVVPLRFFGDTTRFADLESVRHPE